MLLMGLKRLLLFGLIAFLVFFLVEAPNEAARVVKTTGDHAGEILDSTAHALMRFIKSLV